MKFDIFEWMKIWDVIDDEYWLSVIDFKHIHDV